MGVLTAAHRSRLHFQNKNKEHTKVVFFFLGEQCCLLLTCFVALRQKSCPITLLVLLQLHKHFHSKKRLKDQKNMSSESFSMCTLLEVPNKVASEMLLPWLYQWFVDSLSPFHGIHV